MSGALKEDFIPYLPTIVPILLKTASQEIEIPDDEELDDLIVGMEVMEVRIRERFLSLSLTINNNNDHAIGRN